MEISGVADKEDTLEEPKANMTEGYYICAQNNEERIGRMGRKGDGHRGFGLISSLVDNK